MHSAVTRIRRTVRGPRDRFHHLESGCVSRRGDHHPINGPTWVAGTAATWRADLPQQVCSTATRKRDIDTFMTPS